MPGKATGLMFRVNQPTINNDIKDATASLDQFGDHPRLSLNGVRQTGGLRGVVSLHAICDRNLHDGAP